VAYSTAMADQIVIGTERFRGNPVNLSFSGKAPEGWRSPRRVAYFGNHRVARSVLDCGGPPPLFPGIISNCANVNRNCYISLLTEPGSFPPFNSTKMPRLRRPKCRPRS
jgi:hypothetical protein